MLALLHAALASESCAAGFTSCGDNTGINLGENGPRRTIESQTACGCILQCTSTPGCIAIVTDDDDQYNGYCSLFFSSLAACHAAPQPINVCDATGTLGGCGTSDPKYGSTTFFRDDPSPSPSPEPVFAVLEGPCHAGNDAEGQTCICSSNYAQECDRRVENEGGRSYYGSSEECLIAYDADNFDMDDQGEGRFLYVHQMDISLSFRDWANSYNTESSPGYGNFDTVDKLWTGKYPFGRDDWGYPLGPDKYDKNRIYLDSVATFNQGFHAIDVADTNVIAFWSSDYSRWSRRHQEPGEELHHDRGGWKICTTPPRTDTGVIAAYVSGPVLACLCFCFAIFYMIRRSRRRSGNARAQRAASVGALRAAAAQRASSVRRALSIPMGTVVTSPATPSTTGVVVSGVVLTSTAEAPGVVVSGAVARAVVEPTKQDPGGSSTVDTSGEPLAERLVRLKELLAAGALTQQEYEGKRDEIMEEVGL